MQRTRGFTLVELMTAILVLGILVAMALPSFREVTRSNRSTAAQNDLVTALTVARSEALRRSMSVSVCASKDGTSCSGTKDWATGWIVFKDPTTAGTVDAADDVLQTWPAITGDTVLDGSDSFIRYASTGMLTPSAGQTFDVYAKDCTGPKVRHVAISAIGLLAATKTNCK